MSMTRFVYYFFLSLVCIVAQASVNAFELQGQKTLTALTTDGQAIVFGRIEFTPLADNRASFKLDLDHKVLTDYFLSMREFKCLTGAKEVACHVPYPYKNPATVSLTDFAWLEHHLLFMFKLPSEFGAKLWNGVYYQLQVSGKGLRGKAQAVDLNAIGAPPNNLNIAPFKPAMRDDYPANARWIHSISID